MLDNKQKVTFPEENYKEIPLGGSVVKVKTYLSRSDQEVLTEVYLERYFSDKTSHVLDAEYSLMLNVIDLCTDIEMVEEKDGALSALFTVDNILSNFEFIKAIRDKTLVNYGEYRALLHKTIEEEKEKRRLEVSLGKVISSIYAKLSDLMDNILEFDSSEESLNRIRDLIKDAEKSPILGEAINAFKKGQSKTG